MKYIFLDRDGVITEEKHLLHKKENLALIPKSAEAIALLNKEGYKVIVITNQPVIARGLCTEEELKEIHEYLQELLKKENAHIDAFYYCPHHPTEGANPIFTRNCECRKPLPGMILQAKEDFKIEDLSSSYLIGDRIADIKAGNLAGCKSILVSTGYGGKETWKDAEPLFRTENLYTAVQQIIPSKEQK